MASKAEQYRQHAQDCLDAAHRIQNAEERAIMLEIAERWIRLAEKEQDASSSAAPAQQQQQAPPKDDKKE
jgi:hypothetical protein